MKKWFIPLAILVTLLWVSHLAAQEGLSVSPRQLTIAAQKGQTETRLLLIRAVEPVNDLEIITPDLSGPNGTLIMPAKAIRVTLPARHLAAHEVLTVPVTFDLTAVPSGQFSGELLINYGTQSLGVPVSVAVKDRPWLPLLALVGGVALGIGVSTYRAQGRPRDEVLVRLGQIRTQMKADKELETSGAPFYSRIDAHLVDVEVALEAQQWEKAQQAVKIAEDLWLRWRRARPDWLVQLGYYKQLSEKLATLGDSVFYIGEIKRAALDSYHGIPNLAEPRLFRAELEPLSRQVNAFITLQERIDALAAWPQGRAVAAKFYQRLYALAPTDSAGYQSLYDEVEATNRKVQLAQIEANLARLTKMTTTMSAEQAKPWADKAQELRARLAALNPDDQEAYLTLINDVDMALQQVESLSSSYTGIRDVAAVSFGGVKEVTTTSAWFSAPPATYMRTVEEAIAGAGRRLRWFTWITYAVAVIFLALGGFVQLYGARPDFGVNGIGDYFVLLAWGFGAEATRSSIADMIQGWGISTGK